MESLMDEKELEILQPLVSSVEMIAVVQPWLDLLNYTIDRVGRDIGVALMGEMVRSGIRKELERALTEKQNRSKSPAASKAASLTASDMSSLFGRYMYGGFDPGRNPFGGGL